MKRMLIILSALMILLSGCTSAPVQQTPAIEMRVSEGWIEYTSDGQTWTQLVALDELKGQGWAGWTRWKQWAEFPIHRYDYF